MNQSTNELQTSTLHRKGIRPKDVISIKQHDDSKHTARLLATLNTGQAKVKQENAASLRQLFVLQKQTLDSSMCVIADGDQVS